MTRATAVEIGTAMIGLIATIGLIPPTKRGRGRPKIQNSRMSRANARRIGLALRRQPRLGKAWRRGRRKNDAEVALLVEDAIAAGCRLTGRRSTLLVKGLGDKPALRAFMSAQLRAMTGQRPDPRLPGLAGIVKDYPRLQLSDPVGASRRLFPRGYSEERASAIIKQNIARLIMLVRRHRERTSPP